MIELEANYLKTGKTSWPEKRHKAEFAGCGGDAMQAMGKK